MNSKVFKPMFDLDRLYWSVFTKRRGFDEERWVTVWHPYDPKPQPTGIPIVDRVVTRLHEGCAVANVAAEFGISTSQLSTVLLVLTGMNSTELEQAWRLRTADELLRYTRLSMKEIALRCGYRNASSFSRYMIRQTKMAPKERRHALRQQGDLGKFGL